MPLVPAKCPGCGGDMQIDGSRKEAFCPYCGTKFLVESAVNYYNTKNEYHIEHADIKMEDSKGLETKLRNAEAHLKLKKYGEAAKLFKEITEEFADDYRGWWGVVRAETREFTGARICEYYEGFNKILSVYYWPEEDELEAYLRDTIGFERYPKSVTVGGRLEISYRAVEYYKNAAVSFATPEQAAALETEWASYTQNFQKYKDDGVFTRRDRYDALQAEYRDCRKQLNEAKLFKGKYTKQMELLKADMKNLEQEGMAPRSADAAFFTSRISRTEHRSLKISAAWANS